MTRRQRLGGLALVLGLVAIGCDVHQPISIPPGATQVHVRASEDAVTLAPAAVAAGEVYLVLEGPDQGIVLVSRMADPDEPPGPMDAAQVERVRAGDLQSTSSELFQVSCAPGDWTEETHWDGCGNVFPVMLTPGLYVIAATGGGPDDVVPTAVLEVGP
jgi:hypothetical protein